MGGGRSETLFLDPRAMSDILKKDPCDALVRQATGILRYLPFWRWIKNGIC